MSGKLLTVLVLAALLVGGCGNPAGPDSGEARSEAQAMKDYLLGRNLPTLRDVELWDGPAGQGLILHTSHYQIHTTLLDPLMLSEVPSFMEAAYRGYNNQLPEPLTTHSPFKIYLFATRQQWEDFTDDFAGSEAPMYKRIKAGAYYLNDACVAYNIGRERTFSVLGHEGWHQFTRRHFKYALPSWLDEGIAMQFESFSSDNGRFRFTPDQNLNRLGGLRKTLISDKTIGLSELITMDPGQALSAQDKDAAVTAFYSQSYALARFLREDDFGKRLSNYRQMLWDGLKGSWPISDELGALAADRNIPLTVDWNAAVGTAIFRHYIAEDFEQIEQDYLNFCRRIVYNVRLR